MNYYPFDSQNSLYRNKTGAVAAGENLQLRLLLHRDAHVHKAFARIIKDSDNSLFEIELSPGEWLEDYRFWLCDITLQEGLYWYDFRYTSDYGQFFVVKDNGSLGVVSRESGKSFQQTVYSAEFETPEWLKGGIIYQIFPDRFFNSGKKKLDVPEDRYLCDEWKKTPEHRQNNGKCSLGNDYYGGDLAGIMEKLPYLANLGVSCIYLNPIFEAHSNHRYNTANYEKIDSLLGDEQDLKKLCSKAKKYGIHIILDGVFSHTGDDSIYFNKKRRYGDGGAYNDYNSPYKNWFKFKSYPDLYEAWWGVPSLPETVEENENFLEYITGDNGILRKYLRLGIDGWRLDVADELPDIFLERLREAIKAEKTNAYILGEVWEDASNKVSYGARRRFLQGHQLDSVMNYPFANAILQFVKNGDGKMLCDTVNTILENYPKPAVNLLMNHIGTHDTARTLTVLGASNEFVGDRDWQSQHHLSVDEYTLGVKRLKCAATLQYTLPGVPSIYYGDEAGIEGYGDPFCRAAYPWGEENAELLEFYMALGRLRRNSAAFSDGEFRPVFISENTVAYIRENSKGKAFIAVNRGNQSVDIVMPEEFIGADSSFGVTPHGNTITLLEYEYCVVTRNSTTN